MDIVHLLQKLELVLFRGVAIVAFHLNRARVT